MASARRARNEGGYGTRRSLTSTLPADLAPPSQAWMSDRPSWCVDMGATLVAMTTCDLWLSLARNDVTPRTKVWREGMPYWEALEKVPEFSLALPDLDLWGADRASTAPKPASKAPPPARLGDLSRAVEPRAAAPTAHVNELVSKAIDSVAPERARSAAGVITLVPPSDFATPAPVVVERRSLSEDANAPKKRLFPRLDRRAAISVALGATIAITALTIATTGPVTPRPSSGDHRTFAVAAAPHADAIELTTIVRARPTPEPTSSAEASRPLPPPRGPHAADRGQRRSR